MFKCFECRVEFETVKDLSNHIRTSCYLIRNKTSYSCGQDGCLRHFSSLASLRNHLYKSHSSRVQIQFSNALSSIDQEVVNDFAEPRNSPENVQEMNKLQ